MTRMRFGPYFSANFGQSCNPRARGEIQLIEWKGLLSLQPNHLPAVKYSSMLKAAGVLVSKMLGRRRSESQWSDRCCAALIVLSVCLLALRVTTRFCSADLNPRQSVGSASLVHAHLPPEHSRQRLIKNATNWKRPLVSSIARQVPTLYGCIAPVNPSLPRLLIHESLYNRPPPFLDSSSSLSPLLG